MQPSAHAAALSTDLEYRIIQNVGSGWTTVQLENAYTDAIPVCIYVTASIASKSALPRIRNIQSKSFELSIQEMTGGANPFNSPTPGTVFCVIADAGVHTLPDGRRIQALTVFSDRTTGQANGNWNFSDMEEITGSVASGFSNPVALVQVISSNDSQPSAPFVYDCATRGNPGFFTGAGGRICVGKHTGQIATTRANETIGVIIAEAGTGTVNGIFYAFTRGADSPDGIGTNANSGYTVAQDFDAAVVTQQGEDGGQGGWATLVGADPLPAGFIRISVDEEVVAGDTTRTHVNEVFDYFAFRDDRTVEIEGTKTNAVWDPANEDRYAVPGEDMRYTITITNTGDGSADPGTVFLVDPVPEEVSFYNGDYDPSDADPAAVKFETSSSGLSFTPATDLGFATGSTAPTSMSQCNYTPAAGYDPNVRFVCLKPGGTFLAGDPDPTASFSFRARID